jgi:hypothetical protein
MTTGLPNVTSLCELSFGHSLARTRLTKGGEMTYDGASEESLDREEEELAKQVATSARQT